MSSCKKTLPFIDIPDFNPASGQRKIDVNTHKSQRVCRVEFAIRKKVPHSRMNQCPSRVSPCEPQGFGNPHPIALDYKPIAAKKAMESYKTSPIHAAKVQLLFSLSP